MSLLSQISALAANIGATIKDLTARVTTLESAGSAGIPIQPTQTGSYTFVLSDANTCTPLDVSVSCFATIPANSDVPFPVGTQLFVKQNGAGYIRVLPASGVTTTYALSAKTAAKGEWLCAIQTGPDTWEVFPFIAPGVRESSEIQVTFNTAAFAVVDSGIYTTTLDQNIGAYSLSFGNSITPSSFGATFTHRFTQDSTGGWSVTLPSSFHPLAGSDTQVQQAPGAMTLMVATTVDSGARWEYVMRACGA